MADTVPVDGNSIRMRRARDALERAREAEEQAVEAARESKERSDHAQEVSERGRARVTAAERETTRRVKQRVAEAQKIAAEFVEREREEAEADAEEQQQSVQAEVHAEIEDAQRDAEASQEKAEELIAHAGKTLAEARRLANEATEAARATAAEAQHRAQQLANEAEQQANDAENRITAAEQIRKHSEATTTETARELQRDPTNGGLELYDKPELVELAASVGIEEWTTMTKTELVEAIEKASRTTAWTEATQRLVNRKSQLQRLLETVNDSLDVSTSGIKSRLPSGGDSAKTLEAGLIAAGSLAGLMAGSAGISSLRRRSEGRETTGDDE